MSDFERKLSNLCVELKTIREKISNNSDQNATINTNSTIILKKDELRILREIQSTYVLVTNNIIHCEAELRSLTLPILADEEILFGNLHQWRSYRQKIYKENSNKLFLLNQLVIKNYGWNQNISNKFRLK